LRSRALVGLTGGCRPSRAPAAEGGQGTPSGARSAGLSLIGRKSDVPLDRPR
jgi:hypothetical protein